MADQFPESTLPQPSPREVAVATLRNLLGLPYLWGKKDPADGGMDCSGAVNWARFCAGIAPKSDGARYSAHDLWKKLSPVRGKDTQIGDLVFYGTVKRVTHVMMLVGDGKCIGEAGGGSRCTSVEIAKKMGAFMKILPVTYRRDLVGYGRLI